MSDTARTPKPQSVDIAVITVIPAELDALRRVLALQDDARFKHEGRIYWFGSIRSDLRGRGFSVALTCIGQAGNAASAASTAAVISDVAPKVAVLVGIAGGMRGKRKIGDVVFGEAVVTYEPGAITSMPVSRIRRLVSAVCSIFGFTALADADTRVEHRPTVYEPPRSLWQDVIAYKPDPRRLLAIFKRMEGAFPLAPPGLEKQYGQDVRATLTVHNSVIASGEKLIRAADFFPSVRKIHGKIEVAEMEAAGFALACNMRQLDWVVVRGISDFGDEFKSDDFHKFASAAASTVVLDFLSHGLTLERFHAPTRLSLDRLREWSKTIVEAWEREHGYTPPLPLTFRKGPPDRTADGASMTMSAVRDMLRPGTHTVLEGAPGAGKTFSLIGIAGGFLRDNHRSIALPISLPVLAQSGGDIPRYLANGAAMEREDVDNLLSSSDVILLLDGWNEIPAAAAETVTLAVVETLRRFPNICTVITTRAGIVPPIGATTRLSVEPLGDESRREYVAASKHALVLETAIRDDPRIDDLTRVPLFLVAAAATLDTETASVPSSKYGLLGAVIRRAEAQHAMALQRACGGHHRRYLQAIAVAMQQQRATGLASATVIEHVSRCIAVLTSARTIAEHPDAAAIVEALVNFHLLVRSTDQRIRFQHQQFQEWFATEQVHADLAAALPDNQVRFDQIVAEVCNLPHWEESVTLLLERLREEQSGWSAEAATRIGRSIFGLDAFFGATLLAYITDRSGSALREHVARHLRGLYQESTEESREYAVACMLATASPEFQDIVWPLLEHDDRNVRVTTSRMVAPFPVEALGADWWTRVRRWDEQRRGDFLGEVIMNSDRRLAQQITNVVKDETSGVVQHAILEGLAFRGERALIRQLVSLWGARALVSDQGALFDMLSASLLRDIAPLIEVEASAAEEGTARWHYLAALTRAGDGTARERLFRSATNARDERTAAVFRRLISETARDALLPWLLERLLQGLLWDWESVPFLKEFTPEQRDAVIEDTLRLTPNDAVRRTRLRWISEAWPLMLGERLVSDLLAAVRKGDGEAVQLLEANVHAVPRDTIAEVVAGLRPTEVSSAAEASAMLRILPPNTAGMQGDDPDFRGPVREALRAKVISWDTYSAGATHPVSYRRSLAALLGVVGSADDADIIFRLIATDDEHRRREEAMTGRPYVLSDRTWYAGALTRMGASAALLQLLRRSDYLGSASTALAQRLSPSLVAEVCGAVRSGIESVLSTPESDRDFHWRIEVGDAIVALAKLGDRQVISLFNRLEPQEFFHWKLVEALEELVGRGWVLSAAEIGDLMKQIANHAMHGRYKNEPYLAARCAALLLNSDSPEVGVELARTLLPANLYEGGDRLIRMLGKTKALSAVQLLRELLNEDRVREHRYSEVVNALAEHGSSAANDVLLSELDRLEAETTDDARAPRHALSAALFVAADSSSAVLAALRERLKSLRRPHAIELATETMHRLVLDGHPGGASPTDLLQSIDDTRRWPIPFFVRETVEKTFIEHRPSGPSMYTLVPRSNQRVRRELFRMMREDPGRTQSARRLLILIENARIERGRPEDEPRHPAYDLRNPALINWTAEATPRSA